MQQTLEIIVSFRGGAVPAQVLNGQKTLLNSVESLSTKMKYYEGVAKKAEIGTEEYAKALKMAELSSVAMGKSASMMNSNMQQSTRGSASMTMALQGMNFTIRDSPYFFRDFSLGILAVGNNLNPMIDAVIRAKGELGGWKGFMKGFAQQMMGPAGVIMAFSLIVTAIQAVTFAMANNKREANELGTAYDGLLAAADKYLTITDPRKGMTATLSAEQSKKLIEGLNKQIKLLDDVDKMIAETQSIVSGNATFAIANLLGIGGRDKESIDAIRDSLSKKVGVLESEAIIQKELNALGIQLVDEEKKKKKQKEKHYIVSEAELLKQKEILETLKGQSKSVYDRLQYSKEIAAIEYKLEEKKRLPDFDDLNVYKLDKKTKLEGVEKIDKPKPFFKDIESNVQEINQLVNQLGNNLFQAFLQGKMGADQLLGSLAAIVAQMLFIDGLKWILNPAEGAVGIFKALGFNQGGVVRASGGYVTGGQGSHDYIPALLRSREMVLNPNQQTELYHMAKGIGVGGGGQRVNVTVSGEISAKKDKFVADIKRAEASYYKRRSVSSVSRS